MRLSNSGTGLGEGVESESRSRERIASSKESFGGDRLTWQEILYAADASLVAVRKGTAGVGPN